jgi:hypothetical protein
MFLTPTVVQQEVGAQIAKIVGPLAEGDVLTTSLNGVQIAAHTVSAGEPTIDIASSIAATINGTISQYPDSGLPLNDRFFATATADSVVIRTGFTLECSISPGATVSYTPPKTSPLDQSITVNTTGKITPGDVLTTTIDQTPISYTVKLGDTPASIAAAIATAIKGTTVADPFSGLPLNSLVGGGGW